MIKNFKFNNMDDLLVSREQIKQKGLPKPIVISKKSLAEISPSTIDFLAHLVDDILRESKLKNAIDKLRRSIYEEEDDLNLISSKENEIKVLQKSIKENLSVALDLGLASFSLIQKEIQKYNIII